MTVLRHQPFPHSVHKSATPDEVAHELADWLNRFTGWRYFTSSSARNLVFHLNAAESELWEERRTSLATATAIVRKIITETYETEFAPECRVMMNRWTSGDFAQIHNDHMEDKSDPYYFTHRALLYLSPPNQDLIGGTLRLHAPDGAPSSAKALDPTYNQMVTMAMGEHSYHSVDRVEAGERNVLVWSFTETRD